MDTLTVEELKQTPTRLVEDAARGEVALVVDQGQPAFMAIPLGKGLDAVAVRIELAARLFDREQVSLGIAARIAGLSIGEMIDELGRRKVPVVRYTPEELAQELEYARTLADRG